MDHETTLLQHVKKRKRVIWVSAVLLLSVLLAVGVVIWCFNCLKRPSATVSAISYHNSENSMNKISHVSEELRAVWIATVANIDFPSRAGLGSEALKSELLEIIDMAQSCRMNAIFFQVRPTSDAFYKSDIFPSSAYLCQKQGDPLPFDVLEYLIEKAHEKNIGVYAWVNPLRVTYYNFGDDLSKLCEQHPARSMKDATVLYDDGIRYFDAGVPEVRTLIADGVAEIAENYLVDGIVFDDYFYPYPVYREEEGTSVRIPFNDDASYALYGKGFSSRDEWRRNNVNQLVQECFTSVKAANKNCSFGISPFGVWQNSAENPKGSNTSGFNSYNNLYCDALSWIQGGYVDFIAPQLYWPFQSKECPFNTLLQWWNGQLSGTNIKLYISHAAYKYESWNLEGEFLRQINESRDAFQYCGSIFYGYEQIKNEAAFKDELLKAYKNEVYYYRLQ